jgi:hypothetical protein
MQLEPFLIFLLADPFRPFEISVDNGRTVLVSDPNDVSIYQGGLGLYVALAEDRIEFIEGDAISSLRHIDSRESFNLVR